MPMGSPEGEKPQHTLRAGSPVWLNGMVHRVNRLPRWSESLTSRPSMTVRPRSRSSMVGAGKEMVGTTITWTRSKARSNPS